MANYLELQPAISIFQQKSYSLEPDMINGWRGKHTIFKQIPIRYNSQAIEKITQQYSKHNQNVQQKLIYLGPRYQTNLKAIKNYSGYQYDKYSKQSCVFSSSKLKKYQYKYSKQKQKSFNLPYNSYRNFNGMNPNLYQQQPIVFDSDFQSGNLDLVMKVQQNVYDLFMRVDTNTKGHTSWYFFKIKNKTHTKKSISFNICNFTKKSLLYKKGMKPYIFSKLDGCGWKQAGRDVSYSKKKIRYNICQDIEKSYYTLSFNYEFQHQYDQVYFAYCIPYTYSFLLDFIKRLTLQMNAKNYLKQQDYYQSPGGLKLPVLTITDFMIKKQKKVLLVTGRIHPGQPQGSWMTHGLLNFLCSQDAKQLRQKVIFKIIPMVNVDGVVLGNFRTCLKGLDLNRLFRKSQENKYFQIDYIKQIVQSNKNNIMMYLDFHGHSAKKSVFMYGPQYKIGQTNYYLSRIFPKILSKKTQMFRFYSCIFKISKQKQTTARALMFKQNKIPYCYTIQASTNSYMSKAGEIVFNRNSYIQMGLEIGIQLNKIVMMLINTQINRQIKIQQKQIKKRKKQQFNKQKYEKYQSIQKYRKQIKKKSKQQKKYQKKWDILKNLTKLPQELNLELNEILYQLKNDQQIKIDEQEQSEGSSDCQDSNQDYSKVQMQSFFNKAQKIKKKYQLKLYSNKQTINVFHQQRSIPAQSQNKSLLEKTQLIQRIPQIFKKQNNRQHINYKKKKYINYQGRKKLSTLQTKKQQNIKTKQHLTDKVKLKQINVIQFKRQIEQIQMNNFQYSKRRFNSQSPDRIHKQILDHRKFEFLQNRQSQLPQIISEIVKNHLKNQDIKSKRLNKSIHIIGL